MQIKAQNLSFKYGTGALSVHAIKGVNLTIEEGEIFGIIGHTGSGKSTFIQHINALLHPSEGQITVGEYDLADKKCKFKELRSKVGMVFQYPEQQLFAETVEEDIAFGVKNFFNDKSAEQIKEMVKDALDAVGLSYEKCKDASPFDFSGGQKRRIAIAGVIATKPEILILDEPVSGLDPAGKKELVELLYELKRRFVKTIIIVSHDMDFVAENCTRVAVFSKGEVALCGTPREVFESGNPVLQDLGLPITAELINALDGIGVALDCDLKEDDFVKKASAKLGGAR